MYIRRILVYRIVIALSVSLSMGCASKKPLQNETVLVNQGQSPIVKDNHDDIGKVALVETAPLSSLATPLKISIFSPSEIRKLTRIKKRVKKNADYLVPKYPVADQIVRNYTESKNKEPGGDCLGACKARFHRAYKGIHGHPIYKDLPENIATKYYSPQQVFDHLYASTFGPHKGWKTLPRKYRARGGPGAIANAGMGTLVDWFGIWSGELRPGAVMQVWKRKNDYKKVVRGIREKDFDPFGHSFIFLGYERDAHGEVTGLRIADQGYQSYRPLVPRDYEVWWAVNLEI
ncbi:hypothetical protein [Maribacter sp. 2307UL18-2]|uniref:hypothetical protein n=1 Tax=Maribacter sp. 2307UL18-2 TaxID=3386274 RepID=UPI0039BD68B2